jgi:hypothetical protein
VRNASGFSRVDRVTTVWMAFMVVELLTASALLPAGYTGQIPWYVLLVLGADSCRCPFPARRPWRSC